MLKHESNCASLKRNLSFQDGIHEIDNLFNAKTSDNTVSHYLIVSNTKRRS